MRKELLAELISMALKNDSEDKTPKPFGGSKIKIAVLQRGWVCIGEYSEDGENCQLNNAYVIRRWGTEEGLGQLALTGKQEETKLEKTGVVNFHKLTSVMLIDCNDDIWKKEL